MVIVRIHRSSALGHLLTFPNDLFGELEIHFNTMPDSEQKIDAGLFPP